MSNNPLPQLKGGREMRFHLGDVLSITTGICLSPSKPVISGVYKILNFLTGDTLYTHQLGRATDECKPWILRRHPELAGIKVPKLTPETYKDWLDRQVAKYGEWFDLEPIPKDEHRVINPLTELEDMVGKDKIIAITTDGDLHD